jgi:hypothetical protein
MPWTNPSSGNVTVSTKGDLQGFSTLAASLPVGANGQVVTADSTQALGVKWSTPSSGGTPFQAFEFVQPNQVNSTIGLMSKAASANANPPGLLMTCNNSSPGIQNAGQCDPYMVSRALTINKAILTLAHCSTDVATWVNGMTAEFDVYKIGFSANTLIGTLLFPLTGGPFGRGGQFNDLSLNNFQTVSLTPSIALSAGDLLGVVFKNVGGQVNGLAGFFLTLEAQ